MSLWVAVHGLVDDTDVVADTFNRPLFELAERTNFLYDRVQAMYGSGLFESVRLYDVTVVSGAVVGQIVYRNPDTDTFTPALASMRLADNFTVDDSSFAVGVLVAVDGTVGTVLVSGRCPLITGVIPWTMADLVESGETFRNGPYYLSSLTAGRITANPLGPRIYIGHYGADYAVVNPQYRDTGEAHVHRTYPLYSQPAGTQVVTNPEDPSGTHAIHGFAAGTVGTATRQPLLVTSGDWTGDTVQYTVVLGRYTDVDYYPLGFDTAALYWTSSDVNEGSGVVRVPGFEVPVAIGTKGLKVSLENPTATDWAIPYAAADEGKPSRTWTLDIPTATRGWRARHYRQVATYLGAYDNQYSIQTIGGPLAYADGRKFDTVTLKCPGIIYSLDFSSEPNAGDKTVIDDLTFQYTDDGTVTDPAYIPVLRTGSGLTTATNFIAAALAESSYADLTPVINVDAEVVLLGKDDFSTANVVEHLGVDLSDTGVAAPGAIGSGARLLVYDQYNASLISSGYWTSVAYSTPIELTNGLSLNVIPFSVSGGAVLSNYIVSGDTWTLELADEAPGANFEYALGMHPSLSQFYPPVPMNSAAFILNGVELDPEDMFPANPTYKIGTSGLYWYSDSYGMVPWPADWTSVANPGSQHFQQNAVLHFVHNSGPSGVVTSLRAAANSPIKVKRCNTADDATVGDLEIDLDLNLQAQDESLAGYNVVKATNGQKLLRGPVVERIVAGPGIDVSQAAGNPQGQGTVTIGLSSAATYTGDFEEVALLNAKEEIVGMFPYIRLLPWVTGSTNVPSGFICKFKVPHNISVTSRFRVILYASMFGEVDVAAASTKYAGLVFSYSFLPDYTEIQTGDAFRSLKNAFAPAAPYATRTISVPFGGTADGYTGFDPLLMHTDINLVDVPNKSFYMGVNMFPNAQGFGSPDWPNPDDVCVRAGSLVGIKIQRGALPAGSLTEYTSSLGFINLRWKLVVLP